MTMNKSSTSPGSSSSSSSSSFLSDADRLQNDDNENDINSIDSSRRSNETVTALDRTAMTMGNGNYTASSSLPNATETTTAAAAAAMSSDEPTTTTHLKIPPGSSSSSSAAAAAANGGAAEDRWQPQPDWSIAPGPNEVGGRSNSKYNKLDPILTSQQCYDGLQRFFSDVFEFPLAPLPVDDDDDDDDDDAYTGHNVRARRLHRNTRHRARYEPFTLAVATEASSHLAGLEAVYGQPWIYGGGGLGNMDECPTDNDENGRNLNLQVCLAGGTGRDSLTFASVCIVQDCTARDLLAEDFVERLETASFHVPLTGNNNNQLQDRELILEEYITLHKRVAEVGKFLGTGWVCGEYKVDWDVLPTTIYCLVVAICISLSLLATFWVPKYLRRNHHWQKKTQQHHKQQQQQQQQKQRREMLNYEKGASTMSDTAASSSSSSSSDNEDTEQSQPSSENSSERSMTRTALIDGESKSCDHTAMTVPISMSIIDKFVLGGRNLDNSDSSHEQNDDENHTIVLPPFWSVWNIQENLKRLVIHRPETACLDGLKVGSILWIIAAHVMAIQSSTGAGYLNPKDFLPPNGITTTFIGQLLFSSRFAVDTFLCISGYLAMYVLQKKLKSRGGRGTKPWDILGVLLLRILRILPLYVFCLGFWMFIAPHLGSGPFWYQWENFLEPCRNSWWTNLLFVNNFLPWGVSTTASCFYHSWYLAVDVQLFFLFSPWLVLLFRRSTKIAIQCTLFLWLASVVVTAVLTYTQMWSVNTFDGGQVALFDVEGYAKPHVRAQSYLAGILVAMWPSRQSQNHERRSPSWSSSGSHSATLGTKIRSWFRHSDTWLTVLCLSCLTFLSFVTFTGAYSRRACTFEELPAYNDCGSIWSPTATFLYTAFSRAAWSICIAILMHLCLETHSKHMQNDGSDTGSKTFLASHQQSPQRGYATMAVKNVLCWNIWTPLAHLSFGAYLIHPIVIFVWKLGGREKVTFRLSSYVMDCCSISVVTFVISLGAALIVEFPFQGLLGLATKRNSAPKTPNCRKIHTHGLEPLEGEISPLVANGTGEYGSTVGHN